MCNNKHMPCCGGKCCVQCFHQCTHCVSCKTQHERCHRRRPGEPSFTERLIQSLKDKVMFLKNESLQLKYFGNPVKKKPYDYYCLMLRKINELDKKRQQLEELFFTRMEQAHTVRSKHCCDYSSLQDSICSLIRLANQLKNDLSQGSNKNQSKLNSAIQSLEAGFLCLSSYVDQLNNVRGNGVFVQQDCFPTGRPQFKESRTPRKPTRKRNRFKNKRRRQTSHLGSPYCCQLRRLYTNNAQFNANRAFSNYSRRKSAVPRKKNKFNITPTSEDSHYFYRYRPNHPLIHKNDSVSYTKVPASQSKIFYKDRTFNNPERHLRLLAGFSNNDSYKSSYTTQGSCKNINKGQFRSSRGSSESSSSSSYDVILVSDPSTFKRERILQQKSWNLNENSRANIAHYRWPPRNDESFTERKEHFKVEKRHIRRQNKGKFNHQGYDNDNEALQEITNYENWFEHDSIDSGSSSSEDVKDPLFRVKKMDVSKHTYNSCDEDDKVEHDKYYGSKFSKSNSNSTWSYSYKRKNGVNQKLDMRRKKVALRNTGGNKNYFLVSSSSCCECSDDDDDLNTLENYNQDSVVIVLNKDDQCSSNDTNGLRKSYNTLNNMKLCSSNEVGVIETEDFKCPEKVINCKGKTKVIINKEIVNCVGCHDKYYDSQISIRNKTSKSEQTQVLKSNRAKRYYKQFEYNLKENKSKESVFSRTKISSKTDRRFFEHVKRDNLTVKTKIDVVSKLSRPQQINTATNTAKPIDSAKETQTMNTVKNVRDTSVLAVQPTKHSSTNTYPKPMDSVKETQTMKKVKNFKDSSVLAVQPTQHSSTNTYPKPIDFAKETQTMNTVKNVRDQSVLAEQPTKHSSMNTNPKPTESAKETQTMNTVKNVRDQSVLAEQPIKHSSMNTNPKPTESAKETQTEKRIKNVKDTGVLAVQPTTHSSVNTNYTKPIDSTKETQTMKKIKNVKDTSILAVQPTTHSSMNTYPNPISTKETQTMKTNNNTIIVKISVPPTKKVATTEDILKSSFPVIRSEVKEKELDVVFPEPSDIPVRITNKPTFKRIETKVESNFKLNSAVTKKVEEPQVVEKYAVGTQKDPPQEPSKFNAKQQTYCKNNGYEYSNYAYHKRIYSRKNEISSKLKNCTNKVVIQKCCMCDNDVCRLKNPGLHQRKRSCDRFKHRLNFCTKRPCKSAKSCKILRVNSPCVTNGKNMCYYYSNPQYKSSCSGLNFKVLNMYPKVDRSDIASTSSFGVVSWEKVAEKLKEA